MADAVLGTFDPTTLPLSSTGKTLLSAFESRGALFFGDLVNATGLLRTEVPIACLPAQVDPRPLLHFQEPWRDLRT